MKVFKLISKIVLGVLIIFFLFGTIAGFFENWKVGFFFLLNLIIVTFLFLNSLKDKKSESKKLGKGTIAILSIFVFVFLILAGMNLPETKKTNEKIIANKEVERIKSNEIRLDSTKLFSFQKRWSDSIVKDWNGSYIVGCNVSKFLDNIEFSLSKNATKGNWQNAAESNQNMFKSDYESKLKENFNSEFDLVQTQIILIPDESQQLKNESNNERQNLINKQFSAWDGSHRQLEKYIKANMNDPDSYEHIETSYSDKGSYILVKTKFRGTNSYGAKVVTIIKAKVDIDGNIISVIE